MHGLCAVQATSDLPGGPVHFDKAGPDQVRACVEPQEARKAFMALVATCVLSSAALSLIVTLLSCRPLLHSHVERMHALKSMSELPGQLLEPPIRSVLAPDPSAAAACRRAQKLASHVATVADLMVLAGAACVVTSDSGFSNAVSG